MLRLDVLLPLVVAVGQLLGLRGALLGGWGWGPLGCSLPSLPLSGQSLSLGRLHPLPLPPLVFTGLLALAGAVGEGSRAVEGWYVGCGLGG